MFKKLLNGKEFFLDVLHALVKETEKLCSYFIITFYFPFPFPV